MFQLKSNEDIEIEKVLVTPFEKAIKILKINVISIFAILFLLIAIAFKLIGKAVERFVAFCALIIAYFN